MTIRSIALPDAVAGYASDMNPQPDSVQSSLIAQTQALGSVSGMQIGTDQGAFMTMLARLVNARHAVEVGTFTGFSSLAIARGLPDDGHLLCCDVSDEWTAIARQHWKLADVDQRIELRIAPAIDTLRSLPGDAVIDFSFIDADKGNYALYWDELVPRTRPGGVILVDNVLWSGRVADSSNQEPDTIAIREFNAKVRADARCESVLLPIGDGLTLARRV